MLGCLGGAIVNAVNLVFHICLNGILHLPSAHHRSAFATSATFGYLVININKKISENYQYPLLIFCFPWSHAL